MKELRLFENEKTYISVDKGKVYIKNTQTGEISSRAITLCPGLQIELGRNYREIQDAIRKSRVPVFFKEIVKRKQITYFFIVRMGTGNVPTTELASIVCEGDIIKGLAPEQKIKENTVYQKYLPLPEFCAWSLPAGDSKEEKKAREDAAIDFLIKRFPEISRDDIEIHTEGRKLHINITHELVKMKFLLIMSPKDEGRYIYVEAAQME